MIWRAKIPLFFEFHNNSHHFFEKKLIFAAENAINGN